MPFRPIVAIVVLVSTTVCGCSTRFINEDGPGWSLADKPPVVAAEPVDRDTEVYAVPSAKVSSGGGREPAKPAYDYKGGRDPITGKAATEGPVQPPPAPVVRKVKATTEPGRAAPVAAATAPPAASAAPGAADAKGAIAVVAKGDTLHGLSLKHRVSVKAIMSANNLTNNTIFPGQKLVIPDTPR